MKIKSTRIISEPRFTLLPSQSIFSLSSIETFHRPAFSRKIDFENEKKFALFVCMNAKCNTLKRLLFFQVLLIAVNQLCAQKIAKTDIEYDLKFLNEAVIYGHPANWHPKFFRCIDSTIAGVSKLKVDSLTSWEYRHILGLALNEIGCVHTSIVEFPYNENALIKKRFPFSLKVVGEKLMVNHDSSNVILGEEIISVNEVPAFILIEELTRLVASDGGTDAFGRAYFNRFSASLIAFRFAYPEVYRVETSSGSFDVKAVDFTPTPHPIKYPGVTAIVSERNELCYVDSIAILGIRSFGNDTKSFICEVFESLEEKRPEHLVIDLRGNTGGSRKVVSYFASGLIDEELHYNLLQPKNQRIRSYLNAKGKRQLFLARLKYNVGDFAKRRRNSAGKQFWYTIRPKKRVYQGKIHVITDGFTASSSTILTTWLQDNNRASFYGSQAGGGYNGNNGGSFPLMTLPKTKVMLKFPVYRLRVNLGDQYEGLIPENTQEEGPLFNHDAELELVLKTIAGDQ